ncbi:hypothetical protein B0H16DRAFT_1699686 [Mycena metata]|uniref:Uncharacterized protein n=1 Tax=Mycena metata TaxID=1033252 RepID=A0AAD7MK72_9AGAR|nr:hypothetical protein B0H16DRAFT_1699686 [Mycena metata]
MHINSVFVLLAYTGYSLAGQNAPVLLGAAGNFAILARSGVENVPTSAISGNVGVSPKTASSLTGFDLVQDPSGQFSTSTQVNGRLMGSTDAPPTPSLLSAAVLDMQNAFADAMTRPNPDFFALKNGRIGGANLIPGIYKWTTGVTIASGITLTGGPTDISGSLNQAADVTINLSGGALPQNIFWAVAGTVTLNNNTVFQGNILTKTNIDIGFNAVNNGCLYAQTAVFMKQATILCPGGVVTPPPTSSAPTAPPSTSATPTSTVTTTTVTPQCTATASSTACATVAFQNLNASIHGDDFLTFTLTDTAEECIDFCACIPGCAFANPNFDNGKNTTMLTCAVYSGCHTAADATNTGGQTLPNGTLTTIANSSGFCLIPCGLSR